MNWKKLPLYVVFVVLLAAPVVLSREVVEEVARSEEAIALYGFYLRDVTEEAGISFVHQSPTFDSRLDHIMPQVASMGASVSVVDFDRDGFQDLYVTNSGEGSKNAFFRNLGDGTFEDVAEEVGLAELNEPGTGVSMGTVWGDFDNDGYEDVFVYKWGRSELFRNVEGKSFERVTEKAGFPDWANVHAATWFDYDRDGFLDLIFAGYYHEDLDLWHLPHTRIMPESFEYAQNGGRKYLFRGNGDGTFEDRSELLGPDTRRWAMAIAAVDLRGTGYPDLVIANDYGVDEIYFNDAGKRFIAAGETTRIGFAPKSGMNAAVGDVLNTGQYSIFITNISEPGALVQGNNLWVPRSVFGGDSLTYENMATTVGVELGGWAYGAQFGDLNNDGTLDIVGTNGFISAGRGDYWYDFSKVAGGNTTIISDAANWPAMNGRSHSGHQRKHVWINDGRLRFRDVASAVGLTEVYDGRAVVLADLWNRGVLDVVLAHQNGPLLVYKNTANPERAWIGFDFEGVESNRSAIGTRVEVFWDGKRQVQEVMASSGFCSQNQRRLHFGLGENPNVKKVVIRWPSGRVQTLEAPEPGQVYRIVENESDIEA